jgi:carbon monoxide dehydrogenase subunit G
MTIDDSFEVNAPIAKVWPFLTDVPRLTTCMPDVHYTGPVDDKTYGVKVDVKVGPVAVSYSATIHIDSIDDAAHAVTMTIQGTEAKGRGGVRATMTAQAEDRGETTFVRLHTQAQISGIIATVGGRLVESVAKKMTAEFARRIGLTIAYVDQSM